MMPPDVPVNVSAHPVVIWAAVIATVIAILAVAVPKIRDLIRSVLEDVEARRLRRLTAASGLQAARFEQAAELERQRIEHTARVEAAAAILNDQRVELLTGQLTDIARQLRDQRDRYELQMTALHEQLADTQEALDQALGEISELRRELAEYRERDTLGGT
ncbi:hypothetical protein KDJ57_gp25 [Gordonia phage Catfish]|uniref:Uncharacterized protein n=1 Tax=Gordonia phage Catfish TaxID=2301538 RepID=A0A385D0I8_9CAUD|nr:hypothetical protein KDJ57_gp25 [Gordonia phage Catfish]AXQ51862.1 hypothetical protein SEA_CATFISH_25 [Gordonia phage Catfish]